jgi:hypothetical protein
MGEDKVQGVAEKARYLKNPHTCDFSLKVVGCVQEKKIKEDKVREIQGMHDAKPPRLSNKQVRIVCELQAWALHCPSFIGCITLADMSSI